MFEQIRETDNSIFTRRPVNVETLKIMYSDEVLQELLPTFLKESHELLEKLELGRSKRDLRLIATQAHQLKGVASVLQAADLESLCCHLQKAAQAADWKAVESYHPQVIQESLEVRAFLKTLIKK
jgi:HPt (histidine-containing phosphotransfer) domain-containing protein